jgi:hypothetical protein
MVEISAYELDARICVAGIHAVYDNASGKDRVLAVIIVHVMEMYIDAPDELQCSLPVAVEVRAAVNGESMEVLSEEGCHILLAIERDEDTFDCLMVHDASAGPKLAELFGRQARCAYVSAECFKDQFITKPCVRAHCVIGVGQAAAKAIIEAVNDSNHKDLLCKNFDSIGQIDVPRTMSWILLQVCSRISGESRTALVQSGIKELVQREFKKEARFPPQLFVDEHLQSPVIVTIERPQPPPPSSSGHQPLLLECEAETRPPGLEQAAVAEALFRRTRAMLGQPAFDQFRDVQFLVCIFNTLQAQTAYRIRKAGLLDREQCEDEYSKVVMNTPPTSDGVSWKNFEKFRQRALEEPDTLFVIIADECHWAPTLEQAQNKYVNDDELCDKANVVVLLNPALPSCWPVRQLYACEATPVLLALKIRRRLGATH